MPHSEATSARSAALLCDLLLLGWHSRLLDLLQGPALGIHPLDPSIRRPAQANTSGEGRRVE